MLSFDRARAFHSWKVKQLTFREYARRENLRRYNRQRGFIINPYSFGAGGGSTDPSFANVISLLHFDGSNGSTTFTDVIGKTWSPVSSGAQLTTGAFKYGTASLSVGSDGIKTADHADWDFGSGAFTVEMWIYDSQGIVFPVVFNKEDAVNFGPVQILLGNNDGSVIMRASNDGSTYGASVSSSAGAVSASTWTHLEFGRSGTTFYGFVGGTSIGTATMSGALITNTDVVTVGAANGSNRLNGAVDDFRATKGVCRHTSNFTPPTAAHPDS